MAVRRKIHFDVVLVPTDLTILPPFIPVLDAPAHFQRVAPCEKEANLVFT